MSMVAIAGWRARARMGSEYCQAVLAVMLTAQTPEHHPRAHPAHPSTLTSNNKESKEVSQGADLPSPTARHGSPRDANADGMQHREPHEGEVNIVHRLRGEMVQELGYAQARARERQRSPWDEVARLLGYAEDEAGG